ncbi:hypothetical protein CDD83_4735 [Cordyceps sp. RAO-2017]|nr:hypothetical protein CDD83_4735 [Cordyceps sp. RAO-2017]
MAESAGSFKPADAALHDANGKFNGKPGGRSTTKKKSRGFFSWALSLAARLAIWGAIFTILFRCPSSIETCDERSPYICQHYFYATDAVSPHLQPYYDRYAAPYVDVARPYYNALDSHLLKPTQTYALRYGAPWVTKGQDYVRSHWQTNGQPRLIRLQALTKAQFDRSVAPYLTKASEALGPYYNVARTNSLRLFHEYALPGYEVIHPYAAQGYRTASGFTVNTALPATYWAWNKGNAFFETSVWPYLHLIYIENVEPQLVRIGERLGRYKNKAKSKVLPQQSASTSPAAESVPSSFSKPTPQSSILEPTVTLESAAPEATEELSSLEPSQKHRYPVEAPTPMEDEDESRRKVREMVAKDLEIWQEKFMSQAEEGAAEIEERVDNISQEFKEERAETTGKQLLQQLNETAESQLSDLKRKILSIVAKAPENAEDEVVVATRSAGLAIKDKAQAVRKWREEYDVELQRAVAESANEHYDILDETRSLALQKIGMKWAWTNGITYRDWAKYHELKRTLSQLTDELNELVVSHPSLLEAQETSAKMEEDGMTIASAAAKELSRLKEVARWKILAGDSSDNFNSESMRSAAEAAEKASRAQMREQEQAKSGVVTNEDSSRPGVSSRAAEKAAWEAASSLSQAARTALEKAENQQPISPIRAAPEGFATENGQDRSESAGNRAPKRGKAALGSADEAETIILATSGAKAEADDESGGGEEDTTTVEAEHPEDSAPPLKAAAFGAAAQAVSDRQPILDESTGSEFIASATSAAQAAYSSAVSAASERYSSALSVVSAQVYGTPKPVHEKLFSSVSAAYDNAVAAASQKMDQAADAASRGVYGTPTPATNSKPLSWDKVEAIAAQRLNEGRLWAEIQYQSALIALGVATPTATPTSATNKLVEQAKLNYYAGLGMAHHRYTNFLSAVSSAWSTAAPTPTPTNFLGSASSVASAAKESATAAAQSVYSAATDGVVSAADGVYSAAKAVEDSFAAVADAAGEQMVIAGAAVAGTWDNVISELSAQVYGEPTAIGWHDKLAESVGSYASTATKTVAAGVSSATGAAQEAAHTATAKIAQQYEAVGEIVSELVSGREPSFSESVLSRLGAIYATASASVGSLASEASAAAAAVGVQVGSAASQATEVVKDSMPHSRDEL